MTIIKTLVFLSLLRYAMSDYSTSLRDINNLRNVFSRKFQILNSVLTNFTRDILRLNQEVDILKTKHSVLNTKFIQAPRAKTDDSDLVDAIKELSANFDKYRLEAASFFSRDEPESFAFASSTFLNAFLDFSSSQNSSLISILEVLGNMYHESTANNGTPSDQFFNRTGSFLEDVLYGSGPRPHQDDVRQYFSRHFRREPRQKRGFFDWIFGGLLGGIQKLIGSVFKVVIEEVVEPIVRELLKFFIELLVDSIKLIFETFLDVIKVLIQPIKLLIKDFINLFIEIFKEIEEIIIDLFKFLTSLILKLLHTVLEVLAQILDLLFKFYQTLHCFVLNFILHFDTTVW